MRSTQIFDELPKIHHPMRNPPGPISVHLIPIKKYSYCYFVNYARHNFLHSVMNHTCARGIASCITHIRAERQNFELLYSASTAAIAPDAQHGPGPNPENREFGAADRNGRQTPPVGRGTFGKEALARAVWWWIRKSVCSGHQVRGTRRFESAVSRLAPVCVSRRSLSGFPFAGGPIQEKSACCGS